MSIFHSNYLRLSAPETRSWWKALGGFIQLDSSDYCSSELLVPPRGLVRGHGLVPGVLVEVGGVRRALDLGQDGRSEAPRLQAVPVEPLQTDQRYTISFDLRRSQMEILEEISRDKDLPVPGGSY